MTDETIETGTDYIRAVLKSRSKQIGFTNRARDWGIAQETLRAFTESRLILSPETLCVIASDLFPHARYNPAEDMMEPLPQPPPKSFTPSAPFVPDNPVKYKIGEVPLYKPAKAAAKPKAKRAGWIG